MRALALLILAALPCLAVTATFSDGSTSLTVYMRKGYILDTYPFLSTRLPLDSNTPITVSGTGDWNLARGGDLGTAACGTFCFNVSTTPPSGSIMSNTLPTGSGATTLYLTWRKTAGAENLPLGSTSGTLTVGSTTLNITVITLAQFDYDKFVYKPGYPSGCTNSVAGFPHVDTCTPTNERPTSTAFTIPAAGESYTDPQFGYSVKRLVVGANLQYSTISAFNADSSLVATEINGVVNIYNRATSALAYGSLPAQVNITKTGWDAFDPDILRYMDGDSLYTRALSTSTVTKVADYGASSGSRPAMTTIEMGGTASITDDNWWVFWDAVATVCAVNLNGLDTTNQESKTFCADVTPLGLTGIDFPQITKVDRGTGKRYVVLVSEPAAQVYSVGATALTHEYAMPTGIPDMTVLPHSEVGEDSNGNQVFFYSFYDPYGSGTYFATLRLSAGTLLQQPAEIGGGMKIHYPKVAVGDVHYGCNGRGTCLVSMYSNTRTTRRVTGVTAANPCQISTAPTAHGYSTGNSVEIGGALGITSINAVWVVTSTGANTFTLDGHNCTGTYTASSAHSAIFAAHANHPNRQEIVVLRPGHEVRRVAIHRNSLFEVGTDCNGGDECTYYNSPRASLSNDGRYIADFCNFGKLANGGICIIDLGFTDDVRLTSAVDPADTLAVLRYNVPAEQGAATVLISASPALTSPVVNVSDSLTAQSRQYVATGLTAATDYFYRVTAGQFSYTGRFRTLPTMSGTGTLRIERSGGGTIEHGTTASLGSSGASPLSLTPSRGLYYYNAGAGVVATVVR